MNSVMVRTGTPLLNEEKQRLLVEKGIGKKQVMVNRSPRKPSLMVEDLSVSVGGFARWND